MAPYNREKVFSPILDSNCEPFKTNVLPTYKDIYLYYLWESSRSKFRPSFSEVMWKIIEKVIDVWKSASMPTVSSKRCFDMMLKFHENYSSLRNNLRRDKGKLNFQNRRNFFTKIVRFCSILRHVNFRFGQIIACVQKLKKFLMMKKKFM